MFKPIVIVSTILGISGCYYLKNSYYHGKILFQAKNIEKWLNDPSLTERERKKILLAKDVLDFVEQQLGLKTHGNYRNYVRLDRRHVSYLLTAAPKWKLEAKKWWYLVVGELPYRGYVFESEALSEAHELEQKGYDTFVRGVTAYSTLGWFKDPILSTMLDYSDEDFVELIIHELIHANVFVEGYGDFNEQLASFLGNWGAILFYESHPSLDLSVKEQAIKELRNSLEEKIQFALFLKEQGPLLERWYEDRVRYFFPQKIDLSSEAWKTFIVERGRKLLEIAQECEKRKLKYCRYISNNAQILAFATYYEGVPHLQKLALKGSFSFRDFFTFVKNMVDSGNINTIIEEF
ncbi:MAG: aminopeptidase [Bdellovibrionaceae bacterium]|nr:aminopeptidase [Pseudobdellovibrionaceae bacterium]MDW8191022.1 aminopeptidase [Pseudobdellovibrionaceae bacterium]